MLPHPLVLVWWWALWCEGWRLAAGIEPPMPRFERDPRGLNIIVFPHPR